MPYQLPNGHKVAATSGFDLNGVTYARGWLKTSTEAERTALGLTWVEPEPVPEPAPYQPTAHDVQAEAARRLELIGQEYTRQERETWPTQVAEAKALQADANASAPFLTKRAAGRGVTAAQLATVVLQKSNALAAASGDILSAQDVVMALDPIPADYTDDSRWP